MTTIKRFSQQTLGLSTVEYAVAGGIVVAVGIVAFLLLGGAAEEQIIDMASRVTSARDSIE